MWSVTLEYVNHLQCDSVPLSLVRWDFRSATSSLTQAPASNNVLGWIVSQMLALVWHCANNFVYWLSLSIQSRWTLTLIWSYLQNILELVRSSISENASWWQKVWAPGDRCQMNCTSRAAKFNSDIHVKRFKKRGGDLPKETMNLYSHCSMVEMLEEGQPLSTAVYQAGRDS